MPPRPTSLLRAHAGPSPSRRRSLRGRRAATTLVVALAATSALLAAGPGEARVDGGPLADAGPTAAAPDIVFILMDDYSIDLISSTPALRQLRAKVAGAERGTGPARDDKGRGIAWFDNAVVTDSLCCVSRASIFTGQYPYQHRVFTNNPSGANPIGGWRAYEAHDLDRGFNVALSKRAPGQPDGYQTGYIGKFLNGYGNDYAVSGQVPPVPKDWDYWRGYGSSGTREWDYEYTTMDPGQAATVERSHLQEVAGPDWHTDQHYATNVMSGLASGLISTMGAGGPYFLEVAPEGTHSYEGGPARADDPLFPPALADRPSSADPDGNCGGLPDPATDCSSLVASDLPGYRDPIDDNIPYDQLGRTTTNWQPQTRSQSDAKASENRRNRARMAQSVSRLIERVLAETPSDSYVFITSDNGYHLNQHGLAGGKGTPYDSDVHVPLVVVGPGVETGWRNQLVANVDLAPTFEEISGRQPADFRSGESFLDVLGNQAAPGRGYAFFEHTEADSRRPGQAAAPLSGDVEPELNSIPSYLAVRGPEGLLVRLDRDSDYCASRFEWELYDYRTDQTPGVQHPEARAELTTQDKSEPWAAGLRAQLFAFIQQHPTVPDGCPAPTASVSEQDRDLSRSGR